MKTEDGLVNFYAVLMQAVFLDGSARLLMTSEQNRFKVLLNQLVMETVSESDEVRYRNTGDASISKDRYSRSRFQRRPRINETFNPIPFPKCQSRSQISKSKMFIANSIELIPKLKIRD